MINKLEQTPGQLPFTLEAEILRRIDNPQVPGFVESFTLDGINYIVQEFIDGVPLSYLLDNGHRFSEAEVKEIVLQLLGILNNLHCPPQKKDAVIHRDLRLSNLLLKGEKFLPAGLKMSRCLTGHGRKFFLFQVYLYISCKNFSAEKTVLLRLPKQWII